MSQTKKNTDGFWWWLIRLLSGRPHIEIGGYIEGNQVKDIYLRRWYLIPRNSFLNIYLHQFLRDDDDRALHDHPWDSWSFLVWGSYRERHSWGRNHKYQQTVVYRAPAFITREAEYTHRLELLDNKPAWTVFITGPRRRKWGFWCPKGFVPWDEFTDGPNGERIGKGCGD